VAADSLANESKASCDLCGGACFEQIASRDRRGAALATHVCCGCGLVAHAVIPSSIDLDHYYTSEYRKDYHGELTPSPRRVMRAWLNAERIESQVRPFLEPGKRLLEIGAGIGCTVKVFEQHGWKARGIDPNVGFLQYSRERLHVPVTVGTVQSLPHSEITDVVLLVHVIEHVRSPRAALTHIRTLLPAGGHFYVECPNLAAPFAPFSKLFHFAHIHNFTPLTLQWMAEATGFRLVKRFGEASDPNLQMLFRAESPLHIDPAGGLDATHEALRRAAPVGYHLRITYLANRIKKIASYAREHMMAKRFVRRIEATCRAAG
jgi:SAM-dependent methyltransferase